MKLQEIADYHRSQVQIPAEHTNVSGFGMYTIGIGKHKLTGVQASGAWHLEAARKIEELARKCKMLGSRNEEY